MRRPPPDLLVTGTDTGVGKTLVAAALVLALRERGVRALGFKPVESGIVPGERSDSDVLAVASGVDELLARPLCRLAEPLAPAVAAERAGERLDAASVERRVAQLRAAGYTVVVEGAGGVLVPLAWDFTALDLAVRAGLDVIVVARAGLGTLNHVLLSVEAIARRGVSLRGVVLNGRRHPPDPAEQTNPGVLRRLLGQACVVETPSVEGDALTAAGRMAPALAPLL